jgi:hypothetical protein
VISVQSPAHRQWAEAYVNALRELAPRYGFGFVDGWHKVGRKFWPGVQAAAYLSSYFMAPIGATVWRATTKMALTRQQRTRAICHVLIKSRKTRRCDSILPQRLRTLTAR